MSPEQFDNDRIPDISHIRVWGCKCWAHIHSEKRAKDFSSKALVGHLVGYSTFQRSAYKVFVPELGKVIISRDVRFDEAIPQGPVDEKVKEYFREIIAFKGVYNNDSKNVEDYEYLNPEYSDNQIAPGLLKLLDLNQKNLDYEDVCMNLASTIDDPKTFEEAMSRPKEEAQEWLKATLLECDNLRRRGVLREVALPPGREIRKMDTKMVYKTKIKDGAIDKRKARLVARGFSQQIYEDYNETFAPVARMNSLKIFLKISLDLEHERIVIDFTAAYLYGRVNEELYIDPPAGWDCKEGNVLKVEKALYGTKQAGRSWYEQIKDFLISTMKLVKCKSETCIFISENSNFMIILYVDDAIISFKFKKDYEDFMKIIKEKYEIGEEGPLTWYLGAKIYDYGERIFMSQKDYIEKLIAKYKIEGKASTPMIRDYAIVKDNKDVRVVNSNDDSSIDEYQPPDVIVHVQNPIRLSIDGNIYR
jgi:hypothetical protein